MRYQPDHKEKTRRRVLEEATKAIRRQGPHRLGVARVMKQAGLTHGGFYAHFSSKDALVSAAIAAMFEGTLDRWTRATHDRPPEAGLAAFSVPKIPQRDILGILPKHCIWLVCNFFRTEERVFRIWPYLGVSAYGC